MKTVVCCTQKYSKNIGCNILKEIFFFKLKEENCVFDLIWIEYVCLLNWVWFQQGNKTETGFEWFSTRVWLCKQTHMGLISFVFIHFYLCFPTFIFSLCLGSSYLQMHGRDERKRGECDGTEEVHSFLSSVKAKLANYDVCIAGSANGEGYCRQFVYLES